MKRNLETLVTKQFDLLVIGGGIYGAFAAWDAGLRGLSVALVEKRDFAGATSANSLKMVHGGLRYLQNADIRRMRESIRERTNLMRIAPHLIHPLPCMIPTHGLGKKSRLAMSLALRINELVSKDRNCLSDPQKYIPKGHIVSKDDCRKIIHGISDDGLSGGAIWYDCQIYNSERLIISILRSAASEGAELANYLEVKRFLIQSGRATGVEVEDRITGDRFEIRSRCILNACGPWTSHIRNLLVGDCVEQGTPHVKAIDIIVKRPIFQGVAVGLESKQVSRNRLRGRGSRFYFFVPWRDATMIGTYYAGFHGFPDDARVEEGELMEFLGEINDICPNANITPNDISFLHLGLLPRKSVHADDGNREPSRKYRILDHQRNDGLDGVVSVEGVKYTTARLVVEKAIDRILEKLGKPPILCRTSITPIFGGNIPSFSRFLDETTREKSSVLDQKIIRHLVLNYGSEYRRLIKYAEEDPGLLNPVGKSQSVICSEIVHGIREEMGIKLTDLLFRRTDLCSLGNPGDNGIEVSAEIASKEFRWDQGKVINELYEARNKFPSITHSSSSTLK